jgi:hypothetical protein
MRPHVNPGNQSIRWADKRIFYDSREYTWHHFRTFSPSQKSPRHHVLRAWKACSQGQRFQLFKKNLQHKCAKKVLFPYENTVFSSSIRNAAGE